MTINPEIFRILEEKNVNRDNVLTYLLTVYFGIKPELFDNLTKRQVSAVGILRRDYEKGGVYWTTPLFVKEHKPPGEWDWVSEYRQIFSSVKAGAGGDRADCYNLMEEIFAENPVLTQEIVMQAARAYITEFTIGDNDLKYLQRADYFIKKKYLEEGRYVIKSRLLQYADTTVKRNKQIRIIK